MTGEPHSLIGDLTGALHAQNVMISSVPSDERLAELEAEHRILCDRRRRLHEGIDLLAGVERVKPDAAARLAKYRSTEAQVSRRRQELYRQINALREQALSREN